MWTLPSACLVGDKPHKTPYVCLPVVKPSQLQWPGSHCSQILNASQQANVETKSLRWRSSVLINKLMTLLFWGDTGPDKVPRHVEVIVETTTILKVLVWPESSVFRRESVSLGQMGWGTRAEVFIIASTHHFLPAISPTEGCGARQAMLRNAAPARTLQSPWLAMVR